MAVGAILVAALAIAIDLLFLAFGPRKPKPVQKAPETTTQLILTLEKES